MLIREENEGLCRSIWDDATQVVTSRITFVEAHAAVAAAERSGRVDSPRAKAARTRLGEMWADAFIIEVGAELTYAAAACAKEFGLRGFDAIHCASAMTIGAVDVLAVSGDQALLGGWLRSGLAVADTSLDAGIRDSLIPDERHLVDVWT